MKTQQATIYLCDFCDKRSLTRQTIKRHEKICFMNPDRTPIPGELLHRWALAKHPTPPKWWPMKDGQPRFGCIYDGIHWVDVPGYAVEKVGGPAFALDGEGVGEDYFPYDEDVWPVFGGEALSEIPIRSRLWKLQIHEYPVYAR